MRRLSLALVVLLGFGSAAQAATLGISLNQGGIYNVGDTIEITVSGDAQGQEDYGIQGALNASNPSIGAIATGIHSQNTLTSFGGLGKWTLGVLDCFSSTCLIFNQTGPTLGLNPVDNLLVATFSFLATAPGTSDLSWETDSNTGFQLIFFSLTNAPGATITVVPEPATALLLGLGLVALSWRHSR